MIKDLRKLFIEVLDLADVVLEGDSKEEYINEFDKIIKKNDWIACKERIPNQEDNNENDNKCSLPVLIQDINNDIYVVDYNFITKKFVFLDKDYTDIVVAWRILPKGLSKNS